MSDLLETKREAADNIENAVLSLYKISDSLYTVGLDRAADSINQLSLTILKEIKTLINAIDRDQDMQYKQAQQSSTNVLNAALAGIEIAKSKTAVKTS